jgi:hypothetical protein|tara:strand:+ start:4529 stop:4645 length:117 start_codon:yes stop_codon:yes gene_type:complete
LQENAGFNRLGLQEVPREIFLRVGIYRSDGDPGDVVFL